MKIIREYALKRTMDGLSDDVLLEILVRLPDGRSAIQSSTVCKRWRSLIMNDDFKTMFVKHHDNNDNDDDHSNAVVFDCSNSHNEAPLLHQLPPQQHQQLMQLGPLNGDASLYIVACCDDLILLKRRHSIRHYFLYNWVTKHCLALPEVPFSRTVVSSPKFPFWNTFRYSGGSFGYSILTDPENQLNYKVTLMYRITFSQGAFRFHTAIFDRITGEWTLPMFDIPCEKPEVEPAQGPNWSSNNVEHAEIACANRGTLHWLFGVEHFFGLATFDVFRSKVRMLRLPSDDQLLVDICPRAVKDKVRLAAVQGRVRVSRMVKINDTCFGLRIWELLWDKDDNNDNDNDNDKSDDYSWRLVHDVALEVKVSTTMFFVLAMDPADGNVIYLVRNKDIFRYHIRQHKYEFERVCGVPDYCGESVNVMKERVGRHLSVFNIVPPSWPNTTFFT